jgi:hypothetical protein
MVFFSVSVVGIETVHVVIIVTLILGLELAYWLRHACHLPSPTQKVWDDTVTWIDVVIKKLTLCQESSYVSLYRKCGSGGLFFKILFKLLCTLLVCWELHLTLESELGNLTTKIMTDYGSFGNCKR